MHTTSPQAFSTRRAPDRTRFRVHRARAEHEPQLVDALTLAFADDPPTRWLYPEDGRFRAHFPVFARAFRGDAVALGTAYRVDGAAACALWLPPGEGPHEGALVEHVERAFEPRRRGEVLAVLEALGAVHPSEPHWYLPLIGVAPAFQGHGVGSALLRPVLERCDREGLPAYLEATSPRNARLYERHGFRPREPLRVGACPPITPMWRAPAPPA